MTDSVKVKSIVPFCREFFTLIQPKPKLVSNYFFSQTIKFQFLQIKMHIFNKMNRSLQIFGLPLCYTIFIEVYLIRKKPITQKSEQHSKFFVTQKKTIENVFWKGIYLAYFEMTSFTTQETHSVCDIAK